MNNLARLNIDDQRCIGCGACTRVCPGSLLYLNAQHKAEHHEISEFGWNGCWKCQHCLAVCPAGAISVLGLRPEDSLTPPDPQEAAQVLDRLIACRRSHRRYLRKNVDYGTIRHILEILQNAPNGGNKQLVEYTLIDDVDQMDHLRQIVRSHLDNLIDQGIYPQGYDARSIQDLIDAEKTVRPDMIFCQAPHLLIPHAPKGKGCWQQDIDIACAYAELLFAAHGLGAVMMSFCLDVLDLMPDIKKMLQIPEDHDHHMAIGFGYPEIRYARGAQKENDLNVNVLKFI